MNNLSRKKLYCIYTRGSKVVDRTADFQICFIKFTVQYASVNKLYYKQCKSDIKVISKLVNTNQLHM